VAIQIHRLRSALLDCFVAFGSSQVIPLKE
jgi:hypothetical protein